VTVASVGQVPRHRRRFDFPGPTGGGVGILAPKAIHAFPIVPDQPASYGCIRIPVDDAPFVFRASPSGTPVLIRDSAA
jgi:hypothetical protein